MNRSEKVEKASNKVLDVYIVALFAYVFLYFWKFTLAVVAVFVLVKFLWYFRKYKGRELIFVILWGEGWTPEECRRHWLGER